MDPITGAIVAGVIWFIAAWAGAVTIFWIVAIIGTYFGEESDSAAPVVAGGLIGWILAVIWFVIAIIQVIVQIVHLVQLANGQVSA